MDGAISALAEIGISVRNSAGEMRSVDDILKDLASQWNGLSKAQQQNLGLQIAGRYQLSRFLILMQQFDTAMSASQTAVESNGSAFGENEKYLNSYEAKLNALANSWTKFVTVLNEDILGSGIVGISAMLTGLTNSVSFVVDKFGALPPLFGIIATSFLALNKSTRDAIMGQGLLATSFVRTGDAMTIASGKSKLLQSQLYNLTLTTRAVASGATLMSNAFKTAFTFISRAIIPIAGFMALGEAISYVTKKITDHKQQQEEMNRKLEDYKKKNIEAVSSNREQVEELIEQYKKLSAESHKDTWNTQKEEEYLQIQQKLGELFPSTIAYIDSKGKSHLKTVDVIEKEIEANEKLMKAENDQYVRDAKGRYQEKIDDIEKLRKEYNAYQEDLNSYNNQKKQEDMFPNIKNGIENLDGYISDAETKMTIIESMIANSATAINSEVVSTFDRLLTTLSAKVTPQIQKEMENIIGSLDFSKMKVDDIQKVSEQIAGFTVRLQEAFDSGDSKGFNKITEDFIKYINTLPNGDQAVKGITGSYDDLKTSVDNANESQKEAQKITDDTSDSLGGLEGAADGAAEGMEKLASASERIAGFSSKQVDSVFELIGTYQALNGVQDRTKEQNQLLESTLEALSSQYPNLVKNKEVNIEAIRKEAEQNDLLLKALDKVNSGQATSEEIRTVNAMLGAKNRLKVMGNEVQGLKELMDAYAKSARFALDQANYFYKQGNSALGEMWQMAGSHDTGMSKMAGDAYEAQQSLDGLASKLADMVDYNGQVYKSANQVSKANDKAKKEQDKLAKSMEQSTYVADKYAQSLEKISAALEKQHSIQSKFPEWSQEYRNSLNEELKLLKEKKSVLEAQSKELQNQIRSGNIIKTGVTTTKSTSSPSSKVTGSSTQDIVWNFFKSKGLSDTAVAGIMGNLQQESNFSTTAMGPQTKYGRAYGIAQWLGGRQTNLKKYAASLGKSYSDLEVQLNFLWQELNGAENKTLKYLQSNSGSSASTLAAGFERLFERSGGSAVGKRQSNANNIYSKYNGKKVSTTSSSVTDTSREVAENLSSLDDAKSKLIGINTELVKVNDEIDEIEQDRAINSKASEYEHLMDGVDRTIDKIKSQMSLEEEGSVKYNNLLKQQVSHYKYKQTLLHKEAEYLRGQIKSGKLNKRQVDELTQKVSELSLAWWDVENQINSVNQSLKQMREQVADEVIDTLKDALSQQRDMMSAQYDKQLQDLENAYDKTIETYDKDLEEFEKAHDKKMDLLDDELKKYEDSVNNRIKLMKQLRDEENYDKEVSNRQKEINKIQSKIDEKSLDTSYKGQAEKAKLEEELAKLKEDLSEYQSDREYDLREKNLQDQLEAYQKEVDLQKESLENKLESYQKDIEAKKKAEEEKFKLEQKRIQDEKLANERALNEEIANERKWAKLREEIVSGNLDNVKGLIGNYLTDLQKMNEDTAKSIEISWQNVLNTIDALNKASNSLSDMPLTIQQTIDKMKANSEAWKNASADERKQLEKENQELGSSIGANYNPSTGSWSYGGAPLYSSNQSNKTQDVVNQMKANSAAWSKASASEKKRLEEENKRLGKSIGATYDSTKGIWYKDGIRLYHKGGIVGDKPTNKLAELANKLFNAQPNEQIIKSLKGELQVPPKNIPNGFKNLTNLINSFTPQVLTTDSGITINRMDVRIENIEGGEAGAKSLFKHIDRQMVRRGGRKP